MVKRCCARRSAFADWKADHGTEVSRPVGALTKTLPETQMNYGLRTTLIALTFSILSGNPTRVSGQSLTSACRLMTAADIRAATGRKEYARGTNGDPDGQGTGGGSSCQYGGETFAPGPYAPMVSFVLISGKGYTKMARGFKLSPGCKRETVPGLGDDAFFESCPRDKRGSPLYVKVGANDLVVQSDIQAPGTAVTAKQAEIAIAKGAIAKLRRGVR